MNVSARLERLLLALGADAYRIPDDILVSAPFGETTPDLDGLVRWLGARCAEHADITIPALVEHRFDPLASRVLVEMLRQLARSDSASATLYATALSEQGPLEETLHLGALTRVAALVAAGADEADAELLAIGPLIHAPRPVARTVAMRLGEIGLTEGPLGRRARALLEEALSTAMQEAWELDDAEEVTELAGDRRSAATGRIIDLVAVLGALAAHRQGLTQRLSALAPEVPPLVGPIYVVAYLSALGEADKGPYLSEVHERLERAASDSSPRVRALAVEALGRGARTNPALAEALVDSLTDADESVRIAAALAIAELGELNEEAVRELENMIEPDGNQTALAATRALAKCGHEVPEHLITELEDPLVRAKARVLAQPPGGDDSAFAALLEASVDAESDEDLDLDPRLQSEAVLAEALQEMPSADAGRWMRRFALGEHDDALGHVFYLALEDRDRVPPELLEAATPLFAMLARGDSTRVAVAALVAARLWPDDARLEELILERTEAPVSLLALGALESLSEHVVKPLLAIVEASGDDSGALALAALGRCRLTAEQAGIVATALAAHISDDDPLAEAAHAALVDLVERGVLTAD